MRDDRERQLISRRVDAINAKLDRIDKMLETIEPLLEVCAPTDAVMGLLYHIDKFGQQMESRVDRLTKVLTGQATATPDSS